MKPTEAQIKYRNRLWAKALQENSKKATGQMRNKAGGRCCLQVAEDVAIKCGLDIDRSEAEDSEPDLLVKDFFGWESTDPELSIPFNQYYASSLNDGAEPAPKLSHKQIAECVLNTFCRKKPVWKLVK